MSLETVRISPQGREQLSRLKRYTGIEHWNILCRWAFCVSIAEATKPPSTIMKVDGGVEMTWRTFGGSQSELYLALLKHRCMSDELGLDEKTLTEQFRLHLHRGLSYLAANKEIRSIGDLVGRACRPRLGEGRSSKITDATAPTVAVTGSLDAVQTR